MNEICLHRHWLYFSSITLSFGQGDSVLNEKVRLVDFTGLLAGLVCLPGQTSLIHFALHCAIPELAKFSKAGEHNIVVMLKWEMTYLLIKSVFIQQV